MTTVPYSMFVMIFSKSTFPSIYFWYNCRSVLSKWALMTFRDPRERSFTLGEAFKSPFYIYYVPHFFMENMDSLWCDMGASETAQKLYFKMYPEKGPYQFDLNCKMLQNLSNYSCQFTDNPAELVKKLGNFLGFAPIEYSKSTLSSANSVVVGKDVKSIS